MCEFDKENMIIKKGSRKLKIIGVCLRDEKIEIRDITYGDNNAHGGISNSIYQYFDKFIGKTIINYIKDKCPEYCI
ncbi:hypothetical protein CRU99_01745 [Malaciobacter mytili]|uniref:hypothetical protein n=1 Tax=Malaciobacter mytili TaxID=603050 RepID=UPI00100AACA9|nr:hypothetical protein [Malaciobacter mytili]RXI48007.1 hypothetical protein CRU99_01745 [Malaciobacter mytili]